MKQTETARKSRTTASPVAKLASLLALTLASAATPAMAVTESDQFNFGDNNNDANNSTFYFTSGQTTTPNAGLTANLLTGSAVTGSGPDVGSLAGINDLSPGSGGNGSGTTFGGYNNMAYYGNGTFGSSLVGGNVTLVSILLGGATPSATGYDLSGISIFCGWTDHPSFNNQHYSISLSTDGVNYSAFYSVNYMPFLASGDAALANAGTGDASTLVALSNLNVSGIKGIRFGFSAGLDANSQLQNGQLIQEIEVFGTPTIVPEPSTWALLIGGSCWLGMITVLRNSRLNS